jgi:hypothetical protein
MGLPEALPFHPLLHPSHGDWDRFITHLTRPVHESLMWLREEALIIRSVDFPLRPMDGKRDDAMLTSQGLKRRE